MTVRELIQKLEELSYAGDMLEVVQLDSNDMYPEHVSVTEVAVEEVAFSTKNENWHPVTSPQVSFKGVKRVVVLK
jgi:hypothetical protein